MARQTRLVTGLRDHAWVIELLGRDRGSADAAYAGIYNWLTGLSQPPCLGGVTTAIFATRAEARAARAGLWGYGPRRAAIKKVRVHIEVLPERSPHG